MKSKKKIFIIIVLFASFLNSQSDNKLCEKIIDTVIEKSRQRDVWYKCNDKKDEYDRMIEYQILTRNQFNNFNVLTDKSIKNEILDGDLYKLFEKIGFWYPDSNEIKGVGFSPKAYKRLLLVKCLNKRVDYKKKYSNILFIIDDIKDSTYGVSILWSPPKSKADYNIVSYKTVLDKENFFMDDHGRIWIYDKKCK